MGVWSVEYREHACAADGRGELLRYAQEKKKRESNYPSAATCGVHRRAAHFLPSQELLLHSMICALFTARKRPKRAGNTEIKSPETRKSNRPRVPKARLFALYICTTVSAEVCVLLLEFSPVDIPRKIRIETRDTGAGRCLDTGPSASVGVLQASASVLERGTLLQAVVGCNALGRAQPDRARVACTLAGGARGGARLLTAGTAPCGLRCRLVVLAENGGSSSGSGSGIRQRCVTLGYRRAYAMPGRPFPRMCATCARATRQAPQ